MAETDGQQRDTSVEARFFEAYSDDGLDPELVAIAHGPNPLLPAILLLLVVFAGFMLTQNADDAAYFFVDSQPTELGDVMSWTEGANRRIEEGQLVLPLHRYARLEGVTQRRAVIGDRGFAKLAGVAVIAEMDASLLDETDASRMTVGDYLAFGGEHHVVTEPGRLVKFSELPFRYQRVAGYLSRAFEIEFCGIDADPELIRALRAERERKILMLGEPLGRPATDGEILHALGPACHEVWLFQEGVAPSDHRGAVIVCAGLLLVLLGSIVSLVVWVRRYRAFHRG